MLFTKEAVHVLTSTKKGNSLLLRFHDNCPMSHSLSLTLHKLTHAAALLHELVGPAQDEADVKLEFFERAKGDDGSAHIQKMIDILKEANGSIGALPKVHGPSRCDHFAF